MPATSWLIKRKVSSEVFLILHSTEEETCDTASQQFKIIRRNYILHRKCD